jgi:hypothetical protein
VASPTNRRFGVAARLVRALWQGGVQPSLRNELLARLLEFEEHASLMGCIAAPATAADMPARGGAPVPLLVTTEKGLFLLHDATWRCLLPAACFGIARHGDMLYLGVSAGIHSFVLAAQMPAGPDACALSDVRILIRFETRYHNERIHQIAYDPSRAQVIVANCRRNSVLILDAANGRIIDEKFLFVDGTGYPVYNDQNHINSVAVCGNHLLFAAHSAGANGAALGFVDGNQVRAYGYPARGVHDVVILDGGIMFTDCFRAESLAVDPNISGAIRFRGGIFMVAATEAAVARKVVLRGLAAREAAVVVGYSAFAPRESRMAAGAGGVIVIGADGAGTAIDGPFSQVYDVLPFDGLRSDRAGAACSADDLDRMFRRDVGPLLYDAPVARGARLPALR